MSKESDRKEINRMLHRMVASPFRALLGDGGGTVDVAGKTGYVWARKLGQEEKVFQAFNRGVSETNEGKVVLVQESRIEGLSGYEVIGTSGIETTTSTASLTIKIADKDDDEDHDPYTSTSWDGDSFSNGASGTINWVNAFGMPETPKAVFALVYANDSGSAGGQYYINFKAKSSTTNPGLSALCPRSGNDHLGVIHGWIPVATDGTSYYSVVASGVNTMDITVRVSLWLT